MNLRRIVFSLGLSACAASQASAVEFQPVLDASLGGGYSATAGGAASWGTLGSLYAVGALRSGAWSWLPLAYANATGQERSIEEGTLFVRSFELGLKPAMRWTAPWTGTVSLDAEALRVLNLEAVNEGWGRGLYDYEQYGIGAGYLHPLGASGESLRTRLGYSQRSYPNNRNFAEAAALTQGKNYYYKDFSAISLDLQAQLLQRALTLSYRPEIRSYSDSLVVRSDGTLDLAELRQDLVHSLGVGLGVPLAAGLLGTLDLGLVLNDSNQNLLLQGLGPATFVKDSMDYASQSLDLGLLADTGALWYRSRVLLSYGISLVQSQRPVQLTDGSYTGDKEQSHSHRLGFGVEKFLFFESLEPARLSWQSSAELLIHRSNQHYSAGLRPSYEHWRLQTSLKYTFKREDPQ